MNEPTEDRPPKRTIPTDLQKEVEKMQIKIPRIAGSPGDLDEEKKRWLIVGICLHSIISPLLRKYVYCIVSSLYRSLVGRNYIHKQEWNRYLCKFPATNKYVLNYGSINNNYIKWKHDNNMYDYKVRSHVDLSKLFLQPNMTHYSAIDESCDASALLGMITNISLFPPAVQTVAKKIKSDIRNKWAHCDFKDWNAAKYEDSFNSMTQLVKNVGTSSTEEHKILGELNTWATNGQNLIGLKLGIDIVDEIRQQTNVLSEYALTLRTVTDSERNNLQTELNNLKDDLQERMSNVERQSKKNAEDIKMLNEENKNRVGDYISQNIRAHRRQDIREWEQDQTAFFETRATRHLLESLPLHNCIIVTGSSGCGKSSNIHHAALHLRASFGFEIIPVLTGPSDIMNYFNENKKQVFVVDDICGKETINMQTLQTWRDYSEKMDKIFKVAEKDVASNNDKTVSKVQSPKLLISCRLHIYKESQFQVLKLFTKKECNLLSPKLCLQKYERMLMLRKYLPYDIIDNIKQDTENVDYFPLLCKLSKDKTSDEVNKLFTAPLNRIKTNIITIINENKEQFCALVLCIVFNDGFDTDWLKLGAVSENKSSGTTKLEHIVKEFDIDLSKEMHRNSLKAGFSTLNGTYLKLRGTEYRMIHDKIYKMAAVICGQKLAECFIKYAPSEFIQDHFIFESLTEIQKKDDSIVLLKDQEEDYFERLLCDLYGHVITSTFHNSQSISQTFRDKLISFLRRHVDAKTVLKKLDSKGCRINNELENKYNMYKKTHVYTTPLIESATTGYIDIVQFLIVNVKCNVNKTDNEDRSPLHRASQRGHLAVTKLLLENNADVSQCNVRRESPLCVACKGGHTDIVELLLQKNADVTQCNNRGVFPLVVAIRGGHTKTVELLLQNNADCNKSNNDGESPLYIACEGGHKDIVELLLQKNADVTHCNYRGMSPLVVAIKGGHTKTVELLLQNNADCNKSNNGGESLLYIACKGGHTAIVELLLQKNADVSQCNDEKESPLHVACKEGHTDTVDLLLQNGADIFQTNMDGWPPLIVACEEGYTDTVELLLQNNADVVNCYQTDDTPLFIACLNGRIEIVKLLLQNNADVHTFTAAFGDSPLSIACLQNDTDIVDLLLQNNADISKFNAYYNFPLHDASRYGYTNLVELLLRNNADVSQINHDGESPLYVACEGGHSDTVELLLQKKADVSQCDNEGNSPLHALLIQFHSIFDEDGIERFPDEYIETVEILLAWKADVKMRNKDGWTPLDYVRESHCVELVNLLEENRQLKTSQIN